MSAFAPNLSHCGVSCRDLDLMARFHREVFDMQETDRGQGITYSTQLVFLSARADQRHRLALASGRGPDAPSTATRRTSSGPTTRSGPRPSGSAVPTPRS